MSTQNLSKEELLKSFQQVLKKYEEALLQNAELENLKKIYVELRELKWKILDADYVPQYNKNFGKTKIKPISILSNLRR
jgi:hypothetical protein